MTQPANDLADIARELDIVATWSSGARGNKVRSLADRLWEQAGGRPDAQAGDPHLATPGPGVRAQTTADVVEVDSVGQIADAPAGEQAPVTPVPPAPNGAKTPDHIAKTPREQKPPQ